MAPAHVRCRRMVAGILGIVLPVATQGCADRSAMAHAGAAESEIIQRFPTNGPMQTAWRVRWAEGPGVTITGAWFKTAPGTTWMPVLFDARLAEIFVPYHSGSPRFFDVRFGDLLPLTARDAGCCGELLGDPPVVVKEVRDTGVLWKDDAEVRRGEELVLWGVLDAGSYNYLIQYGFRDDGTVTFGFAATGANLPGRETEAHMHDGIWRIDVDLAGPAHDTVLLGRHLEPVGSPSATDEAPQFNSGREGFGDWKSGEFSLARIRDEVVRNGRGQKIGYDLVPLRWGSSRHVEPFSQHDFWVMRERPTELSVTQLPAYVEDRESIVDSDVVLWYISPMHHVPRHEDGRLVGGSWEGATIAMWAGFELRPRDLFDETPLFP